MDNNNKSYKWEDKDAISLTGKEFEYLINAARERVKEGVEGKVNAFRDGIISNQVLIILENVFSRAITEGVIKEQVEPQLIEAE